MYNLTILIFLEEYNENNLVEEVFISKDEEDDFCEGLKDYEINAYHWISIQDKQELKELEFRNETLKEKAFNYFKENERL